MSDVPTKTLHASDEVYILYLLLYINIIYNIHVMYL